MMIFRNGRLIFPDGGRNDFELVVCDGKISDIREANGAGEEELIDLNGNFLAPGFIDLHLHGAVGHDTMEATPEAFRAICDYHASGGTTSLLLTTATAPITEITAVLQSIRELQRCSRPTQSGRSSETRRQSALATSDSLTRIIGVHVEGPFISKTKRGAQREEFITEPAPQLIDQLLPFSDVIKIVTLAPEVRGALDLIDRLRERNIRVSGGHSDATDDEARAAYEHGMRQITHTFNCMSSARRRGIYRIAGLLEFALSEPEILCELIADDHHVSVTLMKMLYRAKGVAGICLVTDATAGAGLPEGARFSIGGRECLVSNGVCLLADRSALAGSASRMIDLVRTLVQKVDLPLHETVKMATENPARAIGLKSKGRLEIGADADLVVFSPDWDVLRTFVAGEEIFPR